MEFRLTYAGPLLSSSNRNPKARHKQELRKHFHPQLRGLWKEFPHLKEMQHPLPEHVMTINAPPSRKRTDYLADQFHQIGYHFVPLVTRDLDLMCAVCVMYLRPGSPGKIVLAGDIDNRIKTLLDALRMPKQEHELGPYGIPDSNENPFFCLVEDDSLITSLFVETDTLLEPVGSVPSKNDARLLITVRIRPARLTWGNMGFV
jgi:hypothetical protein